jgi:hypothetical protein
VALTEQQLSADLVGAMKARDIVRTEVLRGVLAAVKNLKVERRGVALTEADLVQVVRREIRQRDEAAEFAVKGGRSDILERNRAERAVLEGYLPAPLEPAELEAAIRTIVAAEGRALGAIMARLRERYAGRYDGREASDIARRVLAEAGA